MAFDPQNILIINFGQLGDVILSLPALKAICERFPDSRKSIVVGSACAEIVQMTNLFDEVIPVDRVLLLRSNKAWSSIQILKFAYRIRRMHFDLVIDLHSLPETNLLGYISGAKHRLFANRESRSLDWLAAFKPSPPIEDKSLHAETGYLRVLEPLGDVMAPEGYKLAPAGKDVAYIKEFLDGQISSDDIVIGLNPGAGHVSRCWNIESFLKLENQLSKSPGIKVAVFLGPEEHRLKSTIQSRLHSETILFEGLTLSRLAAAFSMIDVLVSNDTGPMHLASMVGTPVVLLLNDRSPDRYLPRSSRLTALRQPDIEDISVDAVLEAIFEMVNDGTERANADVRSLGVI